VIDEYDIRLVGIDSTLVGERKGRFCTARQDWLDVLKRLRHWRTLSAGTHRWPRCSADTCTGRSNGSGPARRHA
jgi:hypothetical protein